MHKNSPAPLDEFPAPRSRKAILAIAALTFLALVLFGYTFENWRGRHAWQQYADSMRAKGIELSFDAYVPPPVPDDQNFAMTPFLRPLYDFVPGTQTWQDTNALKMIDDELNSAVELSKRMGFDLGGGDQRFWAKGEATDLIVLLGAREPIPLSEYRKPKAPPATPLTTPPATQAAAASVIRDIQKQTVDPILDELLAARQKPYCRFNLKYDSAPVAGILLPHLAKMKGLTRHLVFRADAQLALGNTNAAFEDLSLALYLSDTLKGEPFIISYLVRNACRNLLTQVIYDGMASHLWSDAQLQRLIEGLAKDDFIHDTQRALLGERAVLGLRTIEQIRSGDSKVLQNFGDGDGFPGNGITQFYYLAPSGWFYLEQLNLCRAYDRFLDPVARWLESKSDVRDLFANLDAANNQFTNHTPLSSLVHHQVFAQLLVPALARSFHKGFHAQAVVTLTRVACALERHFLAQGAYPDSLEALVPKYLAILPPDPTTGQSLIYHKASPQHFMLYSVGSNFVDDGGRVALDKKGAPLPDQGDWVWEINAKSAQP